jgi:hypothetical protein
MTEGFQKNQKIIKRQTLGGFQRIVKRKFKCVFSIQFGADRGGAGRFSLGIKGQGGKNTKPKTAARAEGG